MKTTRQPKSKIFKSKESLDKTNVRREGWNADDLGDESGYQDSTEFARQLIRGDESKGSPDDRDIAGVTALNETGDRLPKRNTDEN
jgi:hypothetical protein